jgi:hypothetical protein
MVFAKTILTLSPGGEGRGGERSERLGTRISTHGIWNYFSAAIPKEMNGQQRKNISKQHVQLG